MHIYGSCREKLADSEWSATASSGGNTTSSYSYNFYAQIITRAGRNLLSTAKNIAVNAGEKLTLTVNSGAIKTGEDAFAVLFSASTTTEANAVQIAKIELRDTDQVTTRSLPISIELTEDSHFALSASIEDQNSFPSSPVNGQMRSIDATYWEYSAEDLAWNQVPRTFSTYLGSTTEIGGCDRSQTLINDYYYSPTPYAGDGNDHETPIILWLLNGLTEDGQASIGIGENIALEVKLNSSTSLGASLNKGIKVEVLGYVQRSTGILDTSISEVGTVYIWEAESPLFALSQALPRGYALAVKIIFNFRKSQLKAGITGGESISTILYTQGRFGSFSAVGWFTGNAIASTGNRMRIVPESGGFKRLDGVAIIDNYVTPNMGSESFIVTVADTPNQQIALSGILAGDAFIYQSGDTISATQQLRAKFSTESGEQTPSSWSTSVTLNSNEVLQITIDHPSDNDGIGQIRNDYPDSVISGLNATFTAPYLRLFLDIGGTIYRADNLILVTQSDTQSITLDSLTDFSVVGSLPSNADSSFGFWNQATPTIASASASSSLPIGQVIKVAYSYAYPSPNLVLTKLNHEGLSEIPLTFAEITQLAYNQFQLEGVDQTPRQKANFNDPLFEMIDDNLNDRTNISLPDVRKVYFFASAPTVNDDSSQGYRLGDRWFDTSNNNQEYALVDVTVGAANWQTVGSGTGGSGHTIQVNGSSLTQRTNLNFIGVSGSDSAGNNATEITITPDTLDDSATTNKFASAAELAQIATNQSNISALDTNKIAFTSLTTKGSILAANGTQLIEVGVGVDGQVLVADSTTLSGLNYVTPSTGQAYTVTTANFTQPAINGTVNVEVGSTSNFLAGLSYVAVQTGGNYLVTAINTATNFTLQYLGGGVTPTSPVTGGKKVTPTGSAGSNGKNAQTTTTANFTVPAESATVNIQVADSSIFNTNISVNISGAGDYQITAIIDATNIIAKNLGGTNNAVEGGNIPSGSQIIVIGARGATGAVSAASSLIFNNSISSPVSGAGEWITFIDLDNNNRYTLSNNGNEKVFAFLSDIPVSSVNFQTGAVVLDADDIDDSTTTNKFATASELAAIAQISTWESLNFLRWGL